MKLKVLQQLSTSSQTNKQNKANAKPTFSFVPAGNADFKTFKFVQKKIAMKALLTYPLLMLPIAVGRSKMFLCDAVNKSVTGSTFTHTDKSFFSRCSPNTLFNY
jgi:hypothetical protein